MAVKEDDEYRLFSFIMRADAHHRVTEDGNDCDQIELLMGSLRLSEKMSRGARFFTSFRRIGTVTIDVCSVASS